MVVPALATLFGASSAAQRPGNDLPLALDAVLGHQLPESLVLVGKPLALLWLEWC